MTFWEKIGFTNNEKRTLMIAQGKQQMDETYNWLRSTIVQSCQLSNLLADKNQRIKDLEAEQEMYKAKIAEAQQEKMKQDSLVEEARSQLKQTQSRKKQDIEMKETEIVEAQLKYDIHQSEMSRLHAIAQSAYEDERSRCVKLQSKLSTEVE